MALVQGVRKNNCLCDGNLPGCFCSNGGINVGHFSAIRFKNMPTQTFLAFAMATLLTGCATSDKISSSATPGSEVNLAPFPGGAHLVVMNPKVSFESVSTGELIDYKQEDMDHISREVLRISIDELTAKAGQGIEAANDIELSDAEAELAEYVVRNAHRLFLSTPDQKAIDNISALASPRDVDLVLAEEVKVKVGTGGFWNPLNGAIGHSNNAVHFRAVLIDSVNGLVIWRNSVLLREVIKSGDEDVQLALEKLLSPLEFQTSRQ